jgi:hypothetical protein
MTVGGGRALRGLLLEGLRGCDDRVLAQLGPLASWRALATLWEMGWLGTGKSSVRATSAEIRQRLRQIAEARRSIADAAALAAGAPVCVQGDVTRASTAELMLEDNSGEPAFIPVAELRWIGQPRAAAEGDRVTVLGFAHTELDPAQAPSAPRRLPQRVVIGAAALPAIAHLAMEGAPR